MFYSHEILTSRKYGVATVWLVATLGARSNTKKVTRKAILGVNVKKACQTIIEPEVPMALRLQSNLLYGVSKVYDQQCLYVLHDAQTAQHAIHALIKTSHNDRHDGGASKAKPEQLMIMDDPAFLPEDALPALDFDFSNFDIHTGDSQRSTQSMMSIRHRSGSVSSSHAASMLGLKLPSSSGNSGYQLPNFDPFGDSSAGQERFGKLGCDLDEEELVWQDDMDFDYNEDGELHEISGEERLARQAGAIRADGGRGNSATSVRVRKEHEDSRVGVFIAGEDDYIPQFGNDLDVEILPDADAFDPFLFMTGALGGKDKQQHHSSQDRVLSEDESSSLAQAPQKKNSKAKKKKSVPLDRQLVVLNSDMKLWQLEYVHSMTAANLVKEDHRATKQAKKNAFHFVLGSGLNGVGDGIGSNKLPSPLAMFAGDSLLALITGKELTTLSETLSKGVKRPAESLLSSPNKRIRESELGRGAFDDEGGMVMTMDEDQSHSIEIGRDAASALADYPSSAMMPWNVSASLHSYKRNASGSLQGRSGILGSQIGPVAGPRRLTSASPLIGRGSNLSGEMEQFSMLHEEDLPMDYGRSDDFESQGLDFGVGGYQLSLPSDRQSKQDNDFEIFGQAANVDTQTAGSSQWVRDALDKESSNFFEYVRNTISEKTAGQLAFDDGGGGEQLDGKQKNSVTFEELFEIEKNSCIVAAQAFYHVLYLATKSKVWVEQDVGGGDEDLPEPWGEIRIGVS